MSTDFNEQLDTKIASESKLTLESGKVARFAYTEQAFDNDIVAGTATYDYNQQQNVPLASETQMSPEIISKGLRSQASSFTRMGANHFFGRCSYNINKLAVHVKDFLNMFKAFIKEGDNEWSPTVLYEAGDVIYFMSTLNYEPCKRTFICIVDCPSVNLPPVYTDGSLINTAYWKEISGRVASLTVGATNSGSANVATFNGSVTINGNITQSGTPYETHAEQLYTKKDNIITREDATGALPSGQYSGIKVNNYDGNGANGILAYRSDGTAVVGDETGDPAVENLQPLLTRDEESNLVNGAPFVWDAVHKRAISGATSGISVIPVNSTTVSASALSSNEVVQLRFTADIDGADTTTPLAFTWNGNTVPAKAVKNGSLVDIFAQEIDDNGTTVYRYIQNNSLISFLFDGTNLVCEGDAVLISDEYSTVYADGTVDNFGDFTKPAGTVTTEATGRKLRFRDLRTNTIRTFTEYKSVVVPSVTSYGNSGYDVVINDNVLPNNYNLTQVVRNFLGSKCVITFVENMLYTSSSGISNNHGSTGKSTTRVSIQCTDSYPDNIYVYLDNNGYPFSAMGEIGFRLSRSNGSPWKLTLHLSTGNTLGTAYLESFQIELYYYIADTLLP